MRLAFMGTPEFALPTLQALKNAGHEIAAVYTQPPRPAGRGKKERKSPVHLFAEENGLDVYTPQSMKDLSEQSTFTALSLDAAVVVAFGQILPKAVLDAPKHGCFNVHASLLPRWRGAAPIHRAIMAGDDKTGVCIMAMDEGLDTGDVILKDSLTISATDTTQSLHDKLATMGGELIVPALSAVKKNEAIFTCQPDEGITYAKKIDKAEARINWSAPAMDIDRQVRGLSPFPGAWFELNGERIKLLAGSSVKNQNDTQAGYAGTILYASADKGLAVACGEGIYTPTKVQKAGKAAMDIDVFLRGNTIEAGVTLG